MNEEWRRIEGFEDYEVSSLGNVKSYKKDKEGKILKLGDNGNDYLIVDLHNNNERKQFSVHRLVAKAFIPNPENKPCIDHINTIRTDNRVENLRWVTSKENMNNELTLEKLSKAKKGINFSNEHKRKISEAHKKYIYYCKELGKSFNSSKDAEEYCKSIGVKISADHINRCCRGVRKSSGKYNGQKLTWERK